MYASHLFICWISSVSLLSVWFIIGPKWTFVPHLKRFPQSFMTGLMWGHFSFWLWHYNMHFNAKVSFFRFLVRMLSMALVFSLTFLISRTTVTEGPSQLSVVYCHNYRHHWSKNCITLHNSNSWYCLFLCQTPALKCFFSWSHEFDYYSFLYIQ